MTKKSEWKTLLLQKKMWLIFLLGFASGLPLGLSGATLQAWYTVEGVSIVTIGFLGLVGQPYVYKFLWAPLIDKWSFPFLGLRRSWMLITQLGLIMILCLMACLNPTLQPYHLAFLALCLAFLSATQDIAIDAYRTELLAPFERGLGTAMATTGYRIAMLVSGGATLVIAHYVGFQLSYLLMAALMSLSVMATLLGKEPVHCEKKSTSFLMSCIAPFKEFLSRKHALLLLAFVVLYKLGDAFAGSLTTAFLLKGVGFSLKEVGFFYKTLGLASTLLGIFIGGMLMNKIGLFKALVYFGIVQALTNFLFYILSLTGPHYGMLIITLVGENMGGGLGYAAYMVMVMNLCNPRFTATQFALISAVAAVGRVFVGPVAGVMVNNVGWSEFFLWTVVFAVPGLILLWWLKSTLQHYDSSQIAETMVEALDEAKASA